MLRKRKQKTVIAKSEAFVQTHFPEDLIKTFTSSNETLMGDQEQEKEIPEEKDQDEQPTMFPISIPKEEGAASIDFVNEDLADPRINEMPTHIKDQPQSSSL